MSRIQYGIFVRILLIARSYTDFKPASLSVKYPAAKILARCFRKSTFAEQVSGECDFEVVSTAELLLSGMQRNWFGGDSAD